MLDKFIDHLKNTTKKQSFLAKIYGIFTIKTSQFAPLDFIIQQNTAICENSSQKKLIFDLKGNTLKRKTEFKVQNIFKNRKLPSIVLRDTMQGLQKIK